jgi:arylformamidase
MNSVAATLVWEGKKLAIDLSSPVDLSLPLKDEREGKGASAWYVGRPRFEPVRAEGFIGKVSEGGSVNFTNVNFNPHGHGTHTECLGHITPEAHSIDALIRSELSFPWIMPCLVLSVTPVEIDGDFVITAECLPDMEQLPVAIVLRTLPNKESKKVKTWDNTNPPYLHHEFTSELVRLGVAHLLIDLPSVDKEVDGGELLSHRVFFGVPHSLRLGATITEFVFVPNSAPDGLYALNLQVAPFDLDASPSRPVLFPLK